MVNFELIKLEMELPLNATVEFFKLEVNGKCPFDEFWEKMAASGNQNKAMDKVLAIISFLSQGTRVPPEQFKELRHRRENDPWPDYEIRAKQIRIYLFEDAEKRKIIVLGELKTEKTQEKNIAKMRDIKLAYFKLQQA